MFNNRVRQTAVLTAGIVRAVAAIAAGRFAPGLRTLVSASVDARELFRRRLLLVDAAGSVPLVMTCGAAIVFGEDSVSPGAWI